MMTQVESVIVLPQSGQSQDKGASSTYDSGEKEFAQFYSQEQQRQDRVKRSPEDEKQAIGGFVGQKSALLSAFNYKRLTAAIKTITSTSDPGRI